MAEGCFILLLFMLSWLRSYVDDIISYRYIYFEPGSEERVWLTVVHCL